jgi:hypothetical protein
MLLAHNILAYQIFGQVLLREARRVPAGRAEQDN